MPHKLQVMTSDDGSVTRSMGGSGDASVTVTQDDAISQTTKGGYMELGSQTMTSTGDDASSQLIANKNGNVHERQMVMIAHDIGSHMLSNGVESKQISVSSADASSSMVTNGYGNIHDGKMMLTADDASAHISSNNALEGHMLVTADDASSQVVTDGFYPVVGERMMVPAAEHSFSHISNENSFQEGQMMLTVADDSSTAMVTDGSNGYDANFIMSNGDDFSRHVQDGITVQHADDSGFMTSGGYPNIYGEQMFPQSGVNMVMSVADDASHMTSNINHPPLEGYNMMLKGDDSRMIYQADV